MSRETLPRGGGSADVLDHSARDGVRGKVDLLDPLAPGTPLVERRKTHNAFLLGAGSHGGALLEKPHSKVLGVPGAVFKRTVTCDEDTTLIGMSFGPGERGELFRVGAAARVVCIGCIFTKAAADSETFIVVEDGGKLAMFGCTVVDGPGSGDVVNVESAVATDCYVWGSVNDTGTTWGTVTLEGSF